MNLKDLSIKRKLMLITMLTSGLAVVLSSAGFLIYDLISFRQSLSQDLMTQAEIIGYNSAAAMAFKDESAATVTLSALQAKDDIVSAVLYTRDGKIFAQYVHTKASARTFPAPPQERGYRFEGSYLEVFRDVTLNGEPVGTLFLQSDMRQWNSRAKRYATIFLSFVMISGFFALLVSSKLQKLISGPILHLEDTMRMVSATKSYEVRATKFYGDEIGRLIDGFNTMLAEIQHRDGALHHANDELQTRTLELEGEIVHRKEMSKELLNAKHAAEDANRAKSAFLANMSHELRTPLNAIIGYSEMLEEETHELGKVESVKDLQKIQKAGKHLLALINDVLDLSKIEAGRMGLHLETFEISPMIEEMVATLRPALSKNSNTIQVHLAEELGVMRADITKVRQILFNLLSNACKFTDHGTISVDVNRSKDQGEDWIRFQVTDSGIGINAKQKANLFQEFTQADVSIARKYGGTGLGLAISYRYARLMKGRISVESELGHGSVFTVHLPAKVTPEMTGATQAEKISDIPPASSEMKSNLDTILVIDDDSVVRDLMSRFLTKLGFHVVAAASGEEGLRLAKQVNPLVVTLDVIMPDCDGWAVLNQLKADPELAEIPVIMVTVVDNESMGFELGASSYLIKPVDRDRLAVLIEKHRLTRSSTVVGAKAFAASLRDASPKKESGREKGKATRNDGKTAAPVK
jgi:signal transduction histidine kinase/DNA-binding NarL/FixJ family response regulator